MRIIALVCCALALLGCVTRRVVLINQQGDELTCEVTGYGFIGGLATSHKSEECISEAEKRGYRLKEPKN